LRRQRASAGGFDFGLQRVRCLSALGKIESDVRTTPGQFQGDRSPIPRVAPVTMATRPENCFSAVTII